MERRVLLAIFLSFLVLYIYQALVVKPVSKPPNAPAASATSTPEADRVTASPTSPPATPPSEKPPSQPTPSAQPLVADASERDIQIETRDVVAVFTNRGARLKSWRLKHYFDEQRQPQEIIEHSVASQPLPFTLHTSEEATTTTLNSALYTVSGSPTTAPIASAVDLRFEYRDAGGLHAVKQF